MRLVSKKYLSITALLFIIFCINLFFTGTVLKALSLEMNGWYVLLMVLLGGTLGIRSLRIIHGHPQFVGTLCWAAILGTIFSILFCGYVLTTATYVVSGWYLAFVMLMLNTFFLMPFVIYITTLPVQKEMWIILSRKMAILRVKKLPNGFILMRVVNEQVDYVVLPSWVSTEISYVSAEEATVFPSRNAAVTAAINNRRYVIAF